jgi:putative phosphoesterase
LESLKSLEVDYLIHAGDFEIEKNLQLLKNANIPYISVFGNNDYSLVSVAHNYSIKQEPHYFQLNNLRFKLMHMPFYMSPDADIIIYGHTHEQEISYTNNTLFLNPGELCARNKPQSEYMLLEITEKEYIITPFINNQELERIVYDRNQ